MESLAKQIVSHDLSGYNLSEVSDLCAALIN